MIIERESSLNYVTKDLYGKKANLAEAVNSVFWITTVLSLLALGFSKAYICIGVYCAFDLLLLLLPKYFSKKCNYILGDALRWSSLLVMPTLMMFSMYVFGCEYVGEIERSSLILIIPALIAVSVLSLYFGLRKISKTTKISKAILISASGGLSFWFYFAVASISKRVFKNIPLVITATFFTSMMMCGVFYKVIPLLYAVIKYKFTWDDIDTLGNSLK